MNCVVSSCGSSGKESDGDGDRERRREKQKGRERRSGDTGQGEDG